MRRRNSGSTAACSLVARAPAIVSMTSTAGNAARSTLLRGGTARRRSRGTASATDPRQKSSNIRSISRRRLSNGCHIWGVSVMVFSIFTGQFGDVFSHDTSSNTIGTRFAHIGMHQKGINAFNGTSNDNFAIHWSIKSRAHTWPLQKIVR